MKKAVREVVREEVKLALREEMVLLRESLRNTNQAPIVEQRTAPQPIVQKQKAPIKKQLTKNSILNDLLNESAPYGKEAYGEAPFAFSSNDVMDFGSHTMTMPGNAPAALVDINNNVVPVASEAVEAVANAVTRDYSELMKAITKKKGR